MTLAKSASSGFGGVQAFAQSICKIDTGKCYENFEDITDDLASDATIDSLEKV